MRALLLIAFLLLATGLDAAVTVKIATLAPEGSGWMREMRAAADQVKQQTEGRVEIRYYPGGVMDIVICAGQEPNPDLHAELALLGKPAHLIGGADEAGELDAKRAIDQGTRLAAAL